MAANPKKAKIDTTDPGIQEFIDDINQNYEALHLAYENQFWGTKMNLGGGAYSTEALSSTKAAMEAFLRDPARLAAAQAKLNELLQAQKAQAGTPAAVAAVAAAASLKCIVRTLGCYQMADPDAVTLRAQCTAVEDALNKARNQTFQLGYRLREADAAEGAPPGPLVERSSVQLRTMMRTEKDEALRKAAWEGLRSIGPFVLTGSGPGSGGGLCAMVRLRNAMARKLGYEDFYDYKVTQAEGFGKARLFGMLDGLLQGSAPLLATARERLAKDKGPAALEPWNTGYMMAGAVESELDPYFPFEKSLEVWGRCFAALGIAYQGATMTLDLLDRKGKYSNGFCHWPQPAWRRADGSWQPSTAHFTSLADPAAVGSGKTALTTLMHEAGHAAHFANIDMPSPLFSQERAPTSVAYAENQSMFLDSLVGDAAWRVRYAKDRTGAPLPWALHAKALEATHPYAVFGLRGMLAVPYFEKALYELPDDQLTPEVIAALADRVEVEVQGGLAARPLLSVPHVISDEASCYYHGYVLAEMSVMQTRAHFLQGGQAIVDNPEVGKALREVYWRPGNSAMFLDLVETLTGAPLAPTAWLHSLNEDLAAKLASEKEAYDQGLAAAAAAPSAASPSVELDMRVLVKDGDDLIADSEKDGGFLGACAAFDAYVSKRFPRDASPS